MCVGLNIVPAHTHTHTHTHTNTHRDLPLLGSVTVRVCRENYNKKKKERSDTDIGARLPFSSS